MWHQLRFLPKDLCENDTERDNDQGHVIAKMGYI